MKKKLEFYHCIILIVGILILDQFLKVYIKLNFPLTIYSDQIIFDYNWFKLLFVENKGMAWGASINDFLPFNTRLRDFPNLTLTSLQKWKDNIEARWIANS